MLNGIRLLGRLGMLPISSFSALTFFGPCTIFFGMQLNKHRIHVQPINFRFIFMYKTPSWHAGRPIKVLHTHHTCVYQAREQANFDHPGGSRFRVRKAQFSSPCQTNNIEPCHYQIHINYDTTTIRFAKGRFIQGNALPITYELRCATASLIAADPNFSLITRCRS